MNQAIIAKELRNLLKFAGISAQDTDVACLLENISHLSPAAIEELMKILLVALVDKIK